MRFCSNCGSGLAHGAAFCINCGAAVSPAGSSDGPRSEPPNPFVASTPSASLHDPLSAFGEQLRAVPWTTLIPLRSWWTDGSWRRGWVGLFCGFAFAPFLVLRVTADDQDINRIAWGFALYFALMWFVVLYSLIRPGRLNWWLLARVAVFTAAAGTAVAIFLEKRLVPDSPNLLQMVVGVGLPEELAKALAVYLFVFRARPTPTTRTFLFAGAVSGLAFGAAEAVSYSQKYADLAPLLSPSSFTATVIWRLLSDSLLHAALAGIVAFFLGLAADRPHKPWLLMAIGLVLAATLHGAYDSWSAGWPGTAVAALIVFVFAGYVRSGDGIAMRLQPAAQTPPVPLRESE